MKKTKSWKKSNGKPKTARLSNPFPDGLRKIAVISPASCPKAERLAEFKLSFEKVCKSELAFSKNILLPSKNKCPAEAHLRTDDFNTAVEDPSTDLLLCSRGGFGSAQILDGINWKILRKKNIHVLGYSDIGALHLAMHKMGAGIPVTSPMADNFFKSLSIPMVRRSFEIAIGRRPSGDFKYSSPALQILNEGSGSLEGPIIPVNLTILASMLGTRFMPNLAYSILLLEDVSEEPYKIDRLLTQIHLAGILDSCSALLFGRFVRCGKRAVLESIFAKFAAYVNGPVMSGIDFGHLDKSLCFRYGQPISIESGGKIII